MTAEIAGVPNAGYGELRLVEKVWRSQRALRLRGLEAQDEVDCLAFILSDGNRPKAGWFKTRGLGVSTISTRYEGNGVVSGRISLWREMQIVSVYFDGSLGDRAPLHIPYTAGEAG